MASAMIAARNFGLTPEREEDQYDLDDVNLLNKEFCLKKEE